MRALSLAAAAALAPAVASAGEVILACTFPKAPPLVLRFPDSPEGLASLSLGGRPAVPAQGGHEPDTPVTAQVDGYDLDFSTETSALDIRKAGAAILSETGTCITIGGPANDRPLALGDAPAPAPSSPEEVLKDVFAGGKWQTKTETSAFDDTTTVYLTLASNEEVRGQFGAPGPAELHLRCQENTTAAFLWVNDLFLSDIQGFGAVDYRIDDQKARVARMEASTSNKALGFWSGGRAIPFIKELAQGSHVVFRLTPFNDSPVAFSFDLEGIDTVLAPLRKACSW